MASPLLDALDVRTVIADPGVTVPSTFPVVDAGVPVVYARPSPGPAVVVPAARPVTLDGAWTAVADPGWDPSATAAVVGLRHPVAGGPGTVTGGPRGTDGERWLVNAPSGGFLRVSGNWDPGWAATIDGHAVPVLRADAIFRGVVVAAGHHRVELSYRNPGEHQGRLVAGAGVVLLLGLLMAGRRRGQAWSPPVRR
ncbi:MAG: YfhO family protein [Acidimicrobiales bacterium]